MDCDNDYMSVYIVKTHQTVYLKQVHFTICKLHLNKVYFNFLKENESKINTGSDQQIQRIITVRLILQKMLRKVLQTKGK